MLLGPHCAAAGTMTVLHHDVGTLAPRLLTNGAAGCFLPATAGSAPASEAAGVAHSGWRGGRGEPNPRDFVLAVLEHELGGLPRRGEHVSAPAMRRSVGLPDSRPRALPSDGGAGPGRDASFRYPSVFSVIGLPTRRSPS
jgi:hypothetical protein